jgi:hypothetical protein
MADNSNSSNTDRDILVNAPEAWFLLHRIRMEKLPNLILCLRILNSIIIKFTEKNSGLAALIRDANMIIKQLTIIDDMVDEGTATQSLTTGQNSTPVQFLETPYGQKKLLRTISFAPIHSAIVSRLEMLNDTIVRQKKGTLLSEVLSGFTPEQIFESQVYQELQKCQQIMIEIITDWNNVKRTLTNNNWLPTMNKITNRVQNKKKIF